jgi:hypothetical protein
VLTAWSLLLLLLLGVLGWTGCVAVPLLGPQLLLLLLLRPSWKPADAPGLLACWKAGLRHLQRWVWSGEGLRGRMWSRARSCTVGKSTFWWELSEISQDSETGEREWSGWGCCVCRAGYLHAAWVCTYV